MEITRHFTATTFIVHQNRVLLHLHKKLGVWLPVGGHIDRDELPEAAAFREVAEETGLEIQLYVTDTPLPLDDDSAEQLVRPVHLILENINSFHQHIDLIYYAISSSSELNPADGETADLHWFNAAELTALDALPNVRVMALEALELLGSET